MYTRDTTLTQQKNRRLKMTEKYIIRESTKDDCDQIMKMIRVTDLFGFVFNHISVRIRHLGFRSD